MKSLVIASSTFRESIRQPFYALVVALTAGVLGLHYFLPFFTFTPGEELRMFKEVSLAYVLLAMLVLCLLLASKVVDEEIENKTMLTLMSKPVRRWELVVGKFVGVMGAVTLALVILAAILAVAMHLRVPAEMRISPDTVDERQLDQLSAERRSQVLSLLPAYVLIWLQIAVMASIAIAISTRAGLVITLVAGLAIFIVAHLTPFIPAGNPGRALTVLLPYLEHFNLNPLIIFRTMLFDGSPPVAGVSVGYAEVWRLVGGASLYAAAYVAFSLLVALALFRTRELG